ncbi:NAD-dependent epimerase/dehydratase family protein [Amycolatopsis sp.]|uniref:NAD-dependent epimerase/dehydratase family protein n=1 Tax=Amycolatopsis sp. TaxID=37632 RepID=UPI002D7F495E|nr:NAD-dependent epimerase/dehydratase family protein [Amycolatopsis sp.]HET6707255.1 NAD-dependent epimerase/dehydratase family protein [Amycolatopsis sp.]
MSSRDTARPLVTVLGSAGFVGSAIVATLAKRPIRLRLVSRRPTPVPPHAAARIEVRAADLTDAAELAGALTGADAVIHLVKDAAGWRGVEDSARSERVNVGVMRDLLGHFRAHAGSGPPPAVIFAGSSSQVGVPASVPVDGSEPDRPDTPYDRQKQAAEELLAAATAHGSVRGLTLRLATVYGQVSPAGPADPGVLTTMVRRAIAGEPLTMWHDGAIRRDFVHVHDVASAFAAAIDHAPALSGRHWLVGTGHGERLRDVFGRVARLVAAYTGKPEVAVRSVPPPDTATPTDLCDMVVDSSAFRSVTGWRHETAVAEGLERTVAALTNSSAGH